LPVPESLLPLTSAREEVVDIDALYRAHARTVARWARRLGGPEIDPEDVMQEVFLVAKRRLHRFEPGGKISTWLFRATEKIVRGIRRRQRVRRVFTSVFLARAASDRGEHPPLSPHPGPSPLQLLEREETCRQVYGILDKMSDKHRRVLILFELEGMSTQQMADLLQTRVQTVRVWLFRARAQFAELEQKVKIR
jgi:RNA polymerase sigma-70 factor, ECF subfamily